MRDRLPGLKAPSRDELLLAIEGLARLVRDEYPSDYSLTDIMTTWGHFRDGERETMIEAVATVEKYLSHKDV